MMTTKQIEKAEKEYFKAIQQHLKKYNKVENVDDSLISDASFCLVQMAICKEVIRDEGTVQKAKTGWGQKSPHQSSYEGYLRYYITVCSELGLSPKARDKWKIETEKTKNPLIK